MFRSLLTTASAVALMAVPALAGDIEAVGNGNITIQQAASMMGYSVGNDLMRIEFAPN